MLNSVREDNSLPPRRALNSVVFATVLVAITVACSRAPSTDVVVSLPDVGRAVTDEQIELIVETIKLYPNNTQMAFAFIKNGELTFYGIKRSADTLNEVENFNKAFEIGSISKVFTSALLADFALNEDLNIDGPINSYYEFPFNGNTQLTFKSLSNHTSGLPRLPSNFGLIAANFSDNPYKDYDEAALEAYLKDKMSLESEPGSVVAYSNLGAGLLAHTLSKLSGKSYEQLLQERIFSQYGMINSSSERSMLTADLVEGLDADGDPTSNWDFDVMAGAGAILSTVEDLAKFASAHYDPENEVLAYSRKTTTDLNRVVPFGEITPALGWFFVATNPGNKYVWHNGGTGGYRSEIAVDVDGQNAVIILSNVSSFNENANAMDNLLFSLMASMSK